jgi:uncharacterized protein (DUF3084 family)
MTIEGKRRRMGLRALAERWWRVGLAIAVVGSVLGVGFAVHAWFSTRDATNRTVAALHDRRDDLAGARDDLAAATDQLEDLQAERDGERATLGVREGERDTAQAALDTAGALLTDLRAQLDAATTDLADSTARRDAFDQCLVGIAEALNQAAVGDIGGLGATMRSIEGSCAEAGAVL